MVPTTREVQAAARHKTIGRMANQNSCPLGLLPHWFAHEGPAACRDARKQEVGQPGIDCPNTGATHELELCAELPRPMDTGWPLQSKANPSEHRIVSLPVEAAANAPLIGSVAEERLRLESVRALAEAAVTGGAISTSSATIAKVLPPTSPSSASDRLREEAAHGNTRRTSSLTES